MKRIPSGSFPKIFKWKTLKQAYFINRINNAVEQKTVRYIAMWDHAVTSKDL